MRWFFVTCFGGATRSMLFCCAFLAASSLCQPIVSAGDTARFAGDELVNAGFVQGDANQDGVIGSDDLDIVLNNYGQPGTWETGDFDNDGTVGFSDLGFVVGNFNGGSTIGGTTPEPGTFALLALGLSGVLVHRWKKRK